MTSSRPDKPGRYSSSTIALVECSVRVSSTLARLIRKSAEKEASGASATDALLTAAGIQPSEVATLHKRLELVSEEAKQWRENAAREHGQLEQSKTAAAERDKERAFLRDDLRKATDSLKGAQQQILTLEAQIAGLTTVPKSRDNQLASSLSVSGLDDCAAAAIRTLRDRLAQGDICFASGTVGEVEAMIANLGRPEMRTLSNMLTRRAWRIHIISLASAGSSGTVNATRRLREPNGSRARENPMTVKITPKSTQHTGLALSAEGSVAAWQVMFQLDGDESLHAAISILLTGPPTHHEAQQKALKILQVFLNDACEAAKKYQFSN